jgi:uncharacterized protein
MTLDEALEALELGDEILPKQAMQYVLDTWEAALPALLRRLDAYNAGEDRTEGNATALFFFLHLCGEKAESRVTPGLYRLLADPEGAEDVLGDGLGATLSGILVSTFDGVVAGLKGVVEAPLADDMARGTALDAMAYLARTGRLAGAEMHAYLLELYDRMQPREAHTVWVNWVDAVAALGHADLSPQAEDLFAGGFIDKTWMSPHHFHDDLALTAADPTGMAVFTARRVAPFSDAIGTLGGWYGFSAAARRERLRKEEREARLALGVTAPRAHRNIGRNEPCPCGSGKKYKKCCLVAA